MVFSVISLNDAGSKWDACRLARSRPTGPAPEQPSGMEGVEEGAEGLGRLAGQQARSILPG